MQLNLVKEMKGDVLSVRLVGEISETTDFNALFGQVPAHLHVSCKEVHRINSSGVKNWVIYFSNQRNKGVKLRFTECSPAIVEQINLMLNFCTPAELESIMVPFACTGCNRQFVSQFKIPDLRKVYKNLPTPKCPKCGQPTEFDDIPKEYFAFLER